MKKTILLFGFAAILLASCGSSITPPAATTGGSKYFMKPGDTIVTYIGLTYFAQGPYKCSYVAEKDPQQPYVIAVTVKGQGDKK